MARQRHDAAFIVGGLLGGMLGAVVTLLNAPQAGARTRAQMGESLQPAREGLQAAGHWVATESREVSERAAATLSAAVPGAGHDEPPTRLAVDFDALAGDVTSPDPDATASPSFVPRGGAERVSGAAPPGADAP